MRKYTTPFIFSDVTLINHVKRASNITTIIILQSPVSSLHTYINSKIHPKAKGVREGREKVTPTYVVLTPLALALRTTGSTQECTVQCRASPARNAFGGPILYILILIGVLQYYSANKKQISVQRTNTDRVLQ